jgi:hypothetical protein
MPANTDRINRLLTAVTRATARIRDRIPKFKCKVEIQIQAQTRCRPKMTALPTIRRLRPEFHIRPVFEVSEGRLSSAC